MTRSSATHTHASRSRKILTWGLALTLCVGACVPLEDAEVAEFVEQTLAAQAEVTYTGKLIHFLFPTDDARREAARPARFTFDVVFKDGTMVRLEGRTREPVESWWKPESQPTEPGTGDAIYFEIPLFDVTSQQALAQNFRFENRGDRQWQGRAAYEIHLIPRHGHGFRYELLVDEQTRLVVRNQIVDSEDRIRRKTVLRDVVFHEALPLELEGRIRKQQRIERDRVRNHEMFVLADDAEARQVFSEFSLPTSVPAGYELHELRRFIFDDGAHGVIAEYTDGIEPLLVFVRPPRPQIPDRNVFSSPATPTETLDGGSIGEAVRGRPDTARQESTYVLREDRPEIGLFSYKVFGESADVMVLTVVSEPHMGDFFATYPAIR